MNRWRVCPWVCFLWTQLYCALFHSRPCFRARCSVFMLRLTLSSLIGLITGGGKPPAPAPLVVLFGTLLAAIVVCFFALNFPLHCSAGLNYWSGCFSCPASLVQYVMHLLQGADRQKAPHYSCLLLPHRAKPHVKPYIQKQTQATPWFRTLLSEWKSSL